MTHLEFPWPNEFCFWVCLVIPFLKMWNIFFSSTDSFFRIHFSPRQIGSPLELPGISIIGVGESKHPKILPEKWQNFINKRWNKFSNNLCICGCTCQIWLMCTLCFCFQADKHSYSSPPQPPLFSNPAEINAHISLDCLQVFISSLEHPVHTHARTYITAAPSGFWKHLKETQSQHQHQVLHHNSQEVVDFIRAAEEENRFRLFCLEEETTVCL